MKWLLLKIYLLFLCEKSAYAAEINDPSFSAKLESLLSADGFHRTLTYNVKAFVRNQDEFSKSCFMMLLQKIPSDLYVDMDEVRNRETFNGPKIIPEHDFDTEKPAFEAREQYVMIYPSKYEFERQTSAFNVTVNIHARYQPAAANGKTTYVELEAAKLYLSCEDLSNESILLTAPCSGKWSDDCKWLLFSNLVKISNTSTLRVPTGAKSIALFVVLSTLATSIFAALIVVYNAACFKYL